MIQPIYEKIDKEFKAFVEDNQKWLHKSEYGTVTDLKNAPELEPWVRGDISIMQDPFLVVYVAKRESENGPWYMFLDKYFDKVYAFFGGDMPIYVDSLSWGK
jgi:hypothetical protein